MWSVLTGASSLAVWRIATRETFEGSATFFLNDDAVIRGNCPLSALTVLEEHPNLVGALGRRRLCGGVSVQAVVLTLMKPSDKKQVGARERDREFYGCNFAVRTAAGPGLRFDPRLLLHSRLKDYHIIWGLAPYGVHHDAESLGRRAHKRPDCCQVMSSYCRCRCGCGNLLHSPMLDETLNRLVKECVRYLIGQGRAWCSLRVRRSAMAGDVVLRSKVILKRVAEL